MKWPEVFGYQSLNVARNRFNRAPQTDSDILPVFRISSLRASDESDSRVYAIPPMCRDHLALSTLSLALLMADHLYFPAIRA